jgi:hypothetical protein
MTRNLHIETDLHLNQCYHPVSWEMAVRSCQASVLLHSSSKFAQSRIPAWPKSRDGIIGLAVCLSLPLISSITAITSRALESVINGCHLRALQ